MEFAEQARRGRPPRVQAATEERRERRRQEGDTDTVDMKLPIPEWVQEKYPNNLFQLRWFRDEPGRVQAAHKNDWDTVEGVDKVTYGFDKMGHGIGHVLCVKHKDWYEADRAPREAARKEVEEQMERGQGHRGAGDDTGGSRLDSSITYTGAGNRLS